MAHTASTLTPFTMLRRFLLLAVVVVTALCVATSSAAAKPAQHSSAKPRHAKTHKKTRGLHRARHRPRHLKHARRRSAKLQARLLRQGVRPQYRTATTPRTMADFLTDVLVDIDTYWAREFRGAGVQEPSISYLWIGPGEYWNSACGVVDQSTVAYCPADRTIYIGQPFMVDLWNATGDFGVAIAVAHEYGHAVQDRLGIQVPGPVKPLELEADCLSGVWANDAYNQGLMEDGDADEAVATALAIGDDNPDPTRHHGSSQERLHAWLTGYYYGANATCGDFLNAA